MWPFNKGVHDANVKADNLAELFESQSAKLNKQVSTTLLTKVTALEDKLSYDIRRTKGGRGRDAAPIFRSHRDASDSLTINSRQNKLRGSIERRFSKMIVGLNPG